MEEECFDVVRAAQNLERNGGACRRSRLVYGDATLLVGTHDRASELRFFNLPLLATFQGFGRL
jgi:hypothetical protein